jgi:hypothetical protein
VTPRTAEWSTGTPTLRWTGGGITITISMSVLSTQYVLIPVFTTVAGVTIDPTSDPVVFAFKQAGAEPVTGDWVTGSWMTGVTSPGTFIAQCLIGPDGGTTTPTPGAYAIWVKITDSPEVPVLQPGIIQVTEP